MLTRSLGTLSLVFILFFTTSGGPYTIEALVHEVGPGLALLILVVVPLVYSLPEILIVGELASMLPLEGGYYRWVQRAFGPFWGFQNGWLTWAYSLVDMALYPKLFVTYLRWFVPTISPAMAWGIGLVMIWVATGINLRGAGRVGRSSVVAGALILCGFALVALLSIPRAMHLPWHPFAHPGAQGIHGLGVGLSIALWNYIGWDNASTLQGEVNDATRTYPRALALALPLVMASYLIPLAFALAATNAAGWTAGGWPAIAREIGGTTLGSPLAAWIAIGGMVSAVALFNALLLSYSRIPFVMAEDELMPRALGATDGRGTPRTAIIVSAVCYSAMLFFPFTGLVVADVLLYSLALVLELAALVRLRGTEPALRGSFRLPVGRPGVVLIASLPVAVLALVIALNTREGEFGVPALIGALVVVCAGPVLYRLAAHKKSGEVRIPAD